MAKTEAVKFLQNLVRQSELLKILETLSKQDVLAYAQSQGYQFTEQEYDEIAWGMEILVANKLGENFDLTFSGWETMWGKYYLKYLVSNVIDALSEREIKELFK